MSIIGTDVPEMMELSQKTPQLGERTKDNALTVETRAQTKRNARERAIEKVKEIVSAARPKPSKAFLNQQDKYKKILL